jgi:hypothetical protein
MYRYTTDETTNHCQLFSEDVTNGDQKLGFKVDNSDDFVIYTILGAQSVGSVYQTLSDLSLAQCLNVCGTDNQCELFMLSSAGECRLSRSEFEQDYTSMFSVKGNHLYSDITQ